MQACELGPNYHRSFHLCRPRIKCTIVGSEVHTHDRSPHSDNKGGKWMRKFGIAATGSGFGGLGSLGFGDRRDWGLHLLVGVAHTESP